MILDEQLKFLLETKWAFQTVGRLKLLYGMYSSLKGPSLQNESTL